MSQPTRSLIVGMNFLNEFGIGLTNVKANRVDLLEGKDLDINDLGFMDLEQITCMDMMEHATRSEEAQPCIKRSNKSKLNSGIVTSETKDIDNSSESNNDERLITAEGEDDMELDIEPEKQVCVTLPHILSNDQQIELDKVVKLFIPANTEGKLNFTEAIRHHIDTGDAKPICKPQYCMSPKKFSEMKAEVDKMLGQDILAEIRNTAWRSPMHAIKKKDGGLRLVLDARELNLITIGNAKPIRNTNTILSQIEKSVYKSTIDLSQAFHQIKLTDESREKTSFALGHRTYCYNRMTMGLKGSPATLATLVDDIFEDLYPKAFAYVDDFVISSNSFGEHLKILEIIANRLAAKNLAISPEKSKFCYRQLEFLGYLLTEEGLCTNPKKIEPVRNWVRPQTVKEVRRLLGSAGWYRRFIKNYAEITAPLTELIKTKKTKIE